MNKIILNSFDYHMKKHEEEMESKWKLNDIVIQGDDRAQRAIRFNIYTLLVMGCHWNDNTSIGAKGIHGEGYKGHVFWDTEIFILPYYIKIPYCIVLLYPA